MTPEEVSAGPPVLQVSAAVPFLPACAGLDGCVLNQCSRIEGRLPLKSALWTSGFRLPKFPRYVPKLFARPILRRTLRAPPLSHVPVFPHFRTWKSSVCGVSLYIRDLRPIHILPI